MDFKNKLVISILFILIFQIPLYADTCPTETLKNKFQKLSFKDLKNDMNLIVKGADELLNMSIGKNEKCQEKLLSVFRKYYFDTLNKCGKNGNYLSNYSLAKRDVSKEAQINSFLSKAGWTLKESEGILYIGELGGWFEKKFEIILTQPYKQYLELRSNEIVEGFSEDAGLSISWEQLRNRITKWESFLAKYPDFVENPEIREYLDIYIRTYLFGMDNSRIHDFDNMNLRKEVKTSYEIFLKENKSSKYYNLVKDCYEMLRRNKFVVPENYKEYLEKNGLETMLGVQPPTY